MLKSKVFVAAALAVAIGPLGHAQGSKGAPALSAADREEIRVLNAKYSLALGQCDPDHWPLVFAPGDGFFASMGRGRVLGQHRLAEMNRSYDCVYIDGKAQDHAPTVAVPYKIELTATKEGADGFAYYNGGRYEDVYVKTKDGWRFKSRTVVGNREMAAGFSWRDYDAIQRLGDANGGPYEDVYEPWAHGKRFKCANVCISMGQNGTIKGMAYLKDGSHYEDVYAKTKDGSWRFESRTLIAAEGSATRATAAR
jgi:hypothetical protein